MNQPSSKEIRPYPIHRCFREIRMRRHPLSKPHSWVLSGARLYAFSIKECRLHLLLRPRMNDLDEIQRRLTHNPVVKFLPIGIIEYDLIEVEARVGHATIKCS